MKLLVTGGARLRRQCLRESPSGTRPSGCGGRRSVDGNADAVPDGAVFVHDDMVVAAGPLLSAGSFDGVLHFAAKSLVDALISLSVRGFTTFGILVSLFK